jgi:2-keto-4-pentenoate hydratase
MRDQCRARLTFVALACGGFLAAAQPVVAACPAEAEIQAYVAEIAMPRVSDTYARGLVLADAECARGKLVEVLPPVLGRVAGYKAGFTNAAVQQRLGLDGPAWGVMFDGYLFDSGARVPAGIGARLTYEVDLIAVVKNGRLAEAQTPLEALEYLAAFAPFIELPDLMATESLTGYEAIARNISYRGGVRGPSITVEPTQEFLDVLAGMTAVLIDDHTGAELGRGQGSGLLGHPVNSAMWLAQALAGAGIELKAGDLLSLGALIPMAPAEPGLAIRAIYLGLPGDPEVAAEFE